MPAAKELVCSGSAKEGLRLGQEGTLERGSLQGVGGGESPPATVGLQHPKTLTIHTCFSPIAI